MAARLIDLMHLDRTDVLTVDADYENLSDNDPIRAGANKSELSKIRESLSMGGCFYCGPQAKQSIKVANNWMDLEYTYADEQGVQEESVLFAAA